MDAFTGKLNDLLTSVYQSLGHMEAQMVRSNKLCDVSISEVHLLEAVGSAQTPQACTVSALADALSITPPSVTAAVNRLVKKNLLTKARSTSDGRQVCVSLTREGVKIFRIHRLFHRRLANALAADLTEPEKAALLSGMEKLDTFFLQDAQHR